MGRELCLEQRELPVASLTCWKQCPMPVFFKQFWPVVHMFS